MKALLTLAAGLLALGGWWLARATEPAGEARPQASATTTVPSRTARTPVRAVAPSIDEPAAPELSAPTAAAPSPELTIASQRARLEERFLAVTTDGGWASSSQQQLQTDLGRFVTRDVGVRDVQCRASLCRIELALATRDAASGFMESWLRERTWTGPGLADNDVGGADGAPRLVMFVGKEGLEL